MQATMFTNADGPAKRWLKLLLGMAVIWLVVFVLAPLVIKHCAPVAHYVQQAEKYNLSPGALYYSDVPITAEAESNSRNTVRFYYNMARSNANAD